MSRDDEDDESDNDDSSRIHSQPFRTENDSQKEEVLHCVKALVRGILPEEGVCRVLLLEDKENNLEYEGVVVKHGQVKLHAGLCQALHRTCTSNQSLPGILQLIEDDFLQSPSPRSRKSSA